IHADPLPKARGPSGWQSVKQAVDHDVADERYLVVRLSLGAKLFVGVPGRGQQQVSQAISDNPIDLLWHRSVEAAKTRLDVRDLGEIGACAHDVEQPHDAPAWAQLDGASRNIMSRMPPMRLLPRTPYLSTLDPDR